MLFNGVSASTIFLTGYEPKCPRIDSDKGAGGQSSKSKNNIKSKIMRQQRQQFPHVWVRQHVSQPVLAQPALRQEVFNRRLQRVPEGNGLL